MTGRELIHATQAKGAETMENLQKMGNAFLDLPIWVILGIIGVFVGVLFWCARVTDDHTPTPPQPSDVEKRLEEDRQACLRSAEALRTMPLPDLPEDEV